MMESSLTKIDESEFKETKQSQQQSQQSQHNQQNNQQQLKQKPLSESNISIENELNLSQKQSSIPNFNRTVKRTSSRLDFSSFFPDEFQKNIKNNLEQYHEISQNIVLSASSLSKYFSALVNTSQGREKVLAVFQYWGEFQCTLAKHSSLPHIQEQNAKRMLASIRFMFVLKENLSQARKTFRLLKFLDDFKGVSRVIQTKKPFLFKLLGVCALYCSFMYYITDNILFSMTLLIQRGIYIPFILMQCAKKNNDRILSKDRESKWKDRKNSFSLLRILLSIARHLWSLYMRHKKERELYKLIDESDDKQLSKDDKYYDYCQKLIKKRRKRRFEWLELTIDVCRFFMLYKGLKLPGYKIVDPVYVGFCGVLSSCMSLGKMIIDKKIFVSIQPPAATKTTPNTAANSNKIGQSSNQSSNNSSNNKVEQNRRIQHDLDIFKQQSQNLKDFDGLVGNQYQKTNSQQ